MLSMTAPDRQMWHHGMRCPVCLTLGELRPEFGTLYCDKCDQRFSPDWLGHWNKAFAAGRKFEAREIQMRFQRSIGEE